MKSIKKYVSCVYKITNIINNKIYVGSAIDFVTRRYKHLYELRWNKHYNEKLQNAYNKYGEENFIFEIIEKVTKDNLVEREQYYLDLLNPYYNILKKAYSQIGYKHSEKSKNKRRLTILNTPQEIKDDINNRISKTLKSKNQKKTQAEKDNISAKLKNVPFKQTHKDNISKGLKKYQKNISDSHKENLLNVHLNNKWFGGLTHTDENKKFMSDYKTEYWKNAKCKGIGGRKIIQFSIGGEYIKTWDYISDITNKLNICGCNITNVCARRQKTAGGFKWQYESDGIIYIESEEKPHPRIKKIIQSDIYGNVIKIWDSIISAEIALGIKTTNISLVCRGKGKTAGGFIWTYFNETTNE